MKTIILYRPVGLKEFELIADSGFEKFPPRLEWQPIFYPVLNEAYAAQIAQEWNAPDEFSGYCGIVTKFAIAETLFNKYEIQNVGGAIHNELWVPANELDVFNEHIAGAIDVVTAFFGEKFAMPQHALVAEQLNPFIQS